MGRWGLIKGDGPAAGSHPSYLIGEKKTEKRGRLTKKKKK